MSALRRALKRLVVIVAVEVARIVIVENAKNDSTVGRFSCTYSKCRTDFYRVGGVRFTQYKLKGG